MLILDWTIPILGQKDTLKMMTKMMFVKLKNKKGTICWTI